ncbi:hypothetical protein ONZ45_g11647 [Pleurotus djamor]|nr:hypothetical protein ONZ45_g11647 [Pleurotus djamor]
MSTGRLTSKPSKVLPNHLRYERRQMMRQAIFQGLSDSERKIRSLSAVTLSHIAHCDWPDEYPDLLTNLLQLLSSVSPDSIHGAMQVFTELIKSDLTENQILPMLRDLLPVLLNILGSTDHTPLTRSRTISVFRQCAEALFMVKEQHPQAIREATASVLPVWLEAFKVLLNIDPPQDFSAPTWDSLHVSHTGLQTLYIPLAKYYLSADAGGTPGTSEDGSVDLSQLACPIFDFVGRIARHGKAGTWLDDNNNTLLVSAVFKIAQMTPDDVKPIDIEYLLANVIPSVLELSGRAFVFASEYAQLLPLQLAGQYLEAAIHVLEAPTLRIGVFMHPRHHGPPTFWERNAALWCSGVWPPADEGEEVRDRRRWTGKMRVLDESL